MNTLDCCIDPATNRVWANEHRISRSYRPRIDDTIDYDTSVWHTPYLGYRILRKSVRRVHIDGRYTYLEGLIFDKALLVFGRR